MPAAYRFIVGFLRALVRVFFRRVEVTGREHIPAEGGCILVSWHPNGLIDPGLILTQFPRQVVFGARHGLFKIPLFGALMRNIGTVPIYRASDVKGDDSARRSANTGSLDALAAEVARGSCSSLFPEGVSHDAPHPVELKTGAARLYYRARELAPRGGKPPVIIPVGLHYDDKQAFRSNALVAFHAPLELPADLDVDPTGDEEREVRRDRYRRLTAEIERVLHDVAHATEDWETHKLMQRARKLVRAERAQRAGADPGRPRMQERSLGFARIRAGYIARMQSQPEEVTAIRHRVDEYDADLSALGLEDHELDRNPRLASPWLAILLALQAVTVFLLLPPLLLVGYVVNLPTALALLTLSKRVASYVKDEATVKVLVGALAFPLTWVGAGLATAWGLHWLLPLFPSLPASPSLAGLTVAVLGAVGGAVALRYLRVARETARSVRVRLTRSRRWEAVVRLKKERAALCDALVGVAEGLDLPGQVAVDGRVLAQPVGGTSRK